MKKSQELAPGDILKLNGQCAVPADMLLLLTSSYNDGNKCYIETANLDGETNLKVREAPPLLFEHFAPFIAEGELKKELVDGYIECEQPNKNLHKFIGNLHLKRHHSLYETSGGKNSSVPFTGKDTGGGEMETIPLGPDNVLLRSTIFSNTDWGYGIVIYTGKETKIQMNNRSKKSSKMSRLEKNLNTAIIIIICAQIVLVVFSVISIYILGFQNFDNLPYVYPPGTGDSSLLPLWLEQA
jgi:magnesium-transporting ATPase (P-type)